MRLSDQQGSSCKDAAVTFLKLIVARKISEAYDRFVGHDMRHHNAYFPGDAASLREGMEDAHRQFPETTIDIKHVLEDGNLVAVHSHVKHRPTDPGFAVVHLFRFDDNKIVEMWDLGQSVPSDSPNKNGMF